MQTYRSRRRPHLFGAALVLALVTTACTSCVPKTGTTPTPGVPQTALQWTIVYNAALAKADRAVEQATITVHASGAITTDQARPIITVTGQIAAASEAVRAITSVGTEASWNVDVAKIRNIVAVLGPDPFKGIGVTDATVNLAESALSAALTLLIQALGQ